MPTSTRRSAPPAALWLASLLVLTAGCAGPTTIAVHAPRPTDPIKVQGAERVGVELRVVDARSSAGHPDGSRVVGYRLATSGAPGGPSLSNEEPIPALIERSARDQLAALGYRVRDMGPARLTIDIWRFEERSRDGNDGRSGEAEIYLGFTASNASGADCLWDFVHIQVHDDVGATPAGAAQASLEKVLGLAMKYLAEKAALHDALGRAARTSGTSC
jgi:uncharacterized lipoprotein YajG